MSDSREIPRRQLGRTGIEAPALALGGFPLGQPDVPDAEAVATVRCALEHGIDYFDTSPMYGECERRLGLALAQVPRSSVTISTKTGSHPDRRGDYSWDATMWSVENSLRLLRTGYLDVVHIHDPDWLRPGEGLDPILSPGCALDALEKLKGEGVVRAIGLGQRTFELHRIAIATGRFDVILSFNNYHPLDRSAADWLFPLAREHGVGIINGSPMAHGLLAGVEPDRVAARDRLPPAAIGMLPAARRFHRWCRERELPIRAVVLQFCLRQPLIDMTLTGVRSRRELEENLSAATEPLPEWVWHELDEWTPGETG